MRKLAILMLTFLFSASSRDALAEGVLMGVNFWGEGLIPKTAWHDELKQMAESGVKTIRTSLNPETADFVILAAQYGINSVVIVFPYWGKKTWSDVALSEIKPEQLTEKTKPLLDKLEAAGVRLTAFELGNEFNTAGFNSDLPNPGSGRELRLSDLNNPNDPEGLVARGYRAYLQVMAALKDLRDHSKLNQRTPIISGGLAQKLGGKQDEVNLLDTIEFLRQNGLDKLVDGYGVHVYPSTDPNRPVPARIASLQEDMFSACKQGGKPCWITEWGFGNADESCPTTDATRVRLVQAMRGAFQHFIHQRQLAALIWYDWAIRSGKPDSWAIFRCGAITDAGKLALSPM